MNSGSIPKYLRLLGAVLFLLACLAGMCVLGGGGLMAYSRLAPSPFGWQQPFTPSEFIRGVSPSSEDIVPSVTPRPATATPAVPQLSEYFDLKYDPTIWIFEEKGVMIGLAALVLKADKNCSLNAGIGMDIFDVTRQDEKILKLGRNRWSHKIIYRGTTIVYEDYNPLDAPTVEWAPYAITGHNTRCRQAAEAVLATAN